jgi:hypothetical protein
MSKLIIDELFDGVTFTQHVRLKRTVTVAYIRPWIYKQGTLVDGDFRLQIYDGATLLKTVDIPYTTINAAFTEDYAHGYLRFDVEPLNLNVADDEVNHVYEFRFSMVNHTTNLNNFISVCREWDDRKYPLYGTTPLNDMIEPLGYEIYNFDRR